MKNKLLTVLSDAEQFALYGLPDFDDRQRLTYLSLSGPELALASSRPGLHAQVWCALQIGYFKAKQAFFRFSWDDAPEDYTFVLTRYFKDQPFHRQAITKHEHYAQRTMIAALFGYRLWSGDFLTQLAQQAAQIVRRDVTAGFIVAELIAWLNERKIVRPGHTTLQTLISEALSAERGRLGGLLADMVDESARQALSQLLARDDTLSALAALKQDAKNFKWRQMANEREKRARLEPLYLIARTLLPRLAISQRNLHHYASLANFYTVYDLRRLKAEQAHLYLLCYAWQRYRQLTDNLVDALSYHMKQFEDESKARTDKRFLAEQAQREQETPRVGRLLLLYVDDTVTDTAPFGDVRQHAFKIMPREALQIAGQRLSEKPASKLAMRWQIVDGLTERIRRQLRPLYGALDFSSCTPDNPWLAALPRIRDVFHRQQRLAPGRLARSPAATPPQTPPPH